MAGVWDVFLGHASSDKDRGVRELAAELAQFDLRVFVDEAAIDAFDSITRDVEDAIADAMVFVGWFSEAYPTRRACQLELRSAYVAAEGAHEAGERIFAVNPEAEFGHIHPMMLRDARIPRARAAEAILERVRSLRLRDAPPLGRLARLDAPAWVPQRRLGSPRFTGRVAELWDVHEHLQAGRISQISGSRREEVALAGLGGVGKSLLAEEYAHSFGPAYPGGIYWLTATGRRADHDAALLDELLLVAAALGVESGDRPDPAALRHRLATELGGRDRALWIVDDLPEGLAASQAQAWAAPHERAATLVTTRSQAYSAFALISLDVLDADAALRLLTEGCEPASDEERGAAEVIAGELLGGHAQALDIARSQIARRGGATRYRDFVRRTREASLVDRLEHAAAVATQLPNGHEASIVATLSDAIDGLEAEARDLLRAAGVLAAAPIRADLAISVLAGGADDRDEATDRFERSLEGLTRVSLARVPSTTGQDDTFLVHGLVSAVARHIDPAPEQAATQRLRASTALAAEFAAVRDILHDPARTRPLEASAAHARHLTANVAETGEAEIVVLAEWLALFDHARGAYAGARRLQEEVLDARRRLLGDEHPDTIRSMKSLAQTLRELGDFESALVVFAEAQVVERRTLGDDSPVTLATTNALALTLADLGELEDARRLLETVLAAQEVALGNDDSGTLATKNNLARTLRDLGDLEGARRLHEEELAAQRRVSGEDDPDTLTSKNNLAAVLADLGDLEGARRLYLETLAARRRVLGADHPHTLLTERNLARVLHDLGDLEGARQLLDEVLAGWRRVWGDDHPRTLEMQLNLARTLYDMGDFTAAGRIYEDVAAVRSRTLGEEHPDTVAVKRGLAASLYAAGDLERLRGVLYEVATAQRHVLGDEHPETLDTLQNLGSALYLLGDLPEAARLLEAVLAAQRRVLGDAHPDTVTTKEHLAVTLADMGDAEGARRLQEEPL